jgi:hypothetical protein
LVSVSGGRAKYVMPLLLLFFGISFLIGDYMLGRWNFGSLMGVGFIAFAGIFLLVNLKAWGRTSS